MVNPLRSNLCKAQKPKLETIKDKVTDIALIIRTFNPNSIMHKLGFHNVHEAVMNLRPLHKKLENPLKQLLPPNLTYK